MTDKRKDVGNRQYLAELDRIDDMGGVLVPESVPRPIEDAMIEAEMELPHTARKAPSDLQGMKIDEDMAGDDELLLIQAGEDLMRVEQNRPRAERRAANEEEPQMVRNGHFVEES